MRMTIAAIAFAVLVYQPAPGAAQSDAPWDTALTAATRSEREGEGYLRADEVRSNFVRLHRSTVASCALSTGSAAVSFDLLVFIDRHGRPEHILARPENAFVGCVVSALKHNTLAMPPLSPAWVRIGVNARPLVRSIAGISVHSDEATAVRRFGQGCVPNPVYHEDRYYVDSSRSVTLHIESHHGLDLELRAGVHLPKGCRIEKAVARRLTSSPVIDHGIRLGWSQEQLVSVLGPPKEESEEPSGHRLTYRFYADEDVRISIAYDAHYDFVDGRLRGVSLHEGE